jgi:hypothetical protein
MIREVNLNFSMRMRLEFEFRTKVNSWRGFRGAGAPPAVLRRGVNTKIAGGTPAPRNHILYNKACERRSDDSNRGVMSEPGE